MTLEEAINQLKGLRKNQEAFITGEDKNDFTNPFVKNVLAIDKMIEIACECEQLRGMLKATEGHIKFLLECCIEPSSIRATTERILENLKEATEHNET